MAGLVPSTDPPIAYLKAAERISAIVHTRRREMGMSQEQLAELTGLSRNQVQNIENNRNNTRDPKSGMPGPGNPRLDTVFRLAEALEISVVDLITDPEASKP